MAFVRRVLVKCIVCTNTITKKENELPAAFRKRKTCSDECAEIYRTERKPKLKKCFCGAPQSKDSMPYCCWDHRLIAIKCKRWGIVPTMEGYKERAASLEAAQKEVNIRFKDF